MATTNLYTVTNTHAGLRLDKLLQELYKIPFGQIQKLCRTGQVRLDSKRVKGNERVQAGQTLRVPPQVLTFKPEENKTSASKIWRMSQAERKAFINNILYEDDAILVINKPAGKPTQAGSGHSKSMDRLVNGYLGSADGGKIVHRLDKATTGVLVFAKSSPAARSLASQFKHHKTEKIYWALSYGRLPQREGEMLSNLAKSGDSGQEKMHLVTEEEGKPAQTFYRTLAPFGKRLQLLELIPKTGRTHQIRVQLAAAGSPIVGDGKYGGAKLMLSEYKLKSDMFFLHARALHFTHPITGKTMDIVAPVPNHFVEIFELFQFKA